MEPEALSRQPLAYLQRTLLDTVTDLTLDVASAITSLGRELLDSQILSEDDINDVLADLKLRIAFRRTTSSNVFGPKVSPRSLASSVGGPTGQREQQQQQQQQQQQPQQQQQQQQQQEQQLPRQQLGVQSQQQETEQLSPQLQPQLQASPHLPCFPRPSFLPVSGPEQLSLPPEKWGIRYSQLKLLFGFLKSNPLFDDIKREKGYVDLHDINDRAVKPWTEASPCSISLLFNPDGAAASFMVSHAWGEDIEELEEAIDGCFVEQEVEIDSDPVIWICLLAIYQAAVVDCPAHLGPSIAAQLEMKPFESVIATNRDGTLKAMIAAHTTREDIYRRLWCPKELFEAIDQMVEVWMAASAEYRRRLLETYRYWRRHAGSDEEAMQLWMQAGPGITGLALAVDTRTARCSSWEDETRIRNEIESKRGGYKTLDDVVMSLRKRETLRLTSQQQRIVMIDDGPIRLVSVLAKAGYEAAELREAGFAASQLQVKFSAEKLREGGFSVSELQFGGFSDHEIVCAGFDAFALKEAGYDSLQLREAGYLASQAKMAGYSLAELIEADYDVFQLRKAGFRASELKVAGHTAKQLQEGGYSARHLDGAGFDPSEVTHAGYSVSRLRKAGYSAFVLKEAGFSAPELQKGGFKTAEITKLGFPVSQLVKAGFGVTELKELGYDVKRFKTSGYGAAELAVAGFDARKLFDAGFSVLELWQAGYDALELTEIGCDVQSLHQVGFDASELAAVGWDASALMSAGCAASAVRAAGYSAMELQKAGYGPQDLMAAGFDSTDVLLMGYSTRELHDAGFNAFELCAAGHKPSDLAAMSYHSAELRRAGCSAIELKAAGRETSDLTAGGYTAFELCKAGFPASELKEAGFDAVELASSGYDKSDILSAGYDASELMAAGHDAATLQTAGYDLPDLQKVSKSMGFRAIARAKVASLRVRTKGVAKGPAPLGNTKRRASIGPRRPELAITSCGTNEPENLEPMGACLDSSSPRVSLRITDMSTALGSDSSRANSSGSSPPSSPCSVVAPAPADVPAALDGDRSSQAVAGGGDVSAVAITRVAAPSGKRHRSQTPAVLTVVSGQREVANAHSVLAHAGIVATQRSLPVSLIDSGESGEVADGEGQLITARRFAALNHEADQATEFAGASPRRCGRGRPVQPVQAKVVSSKGQTPVSEDERKDMQNTRSIPWSWFPSL
eukprot:TRINITY_DN9424_c0_g1_i2.p1 TRINITY_DN9424_c0_g1~~TRINITY_DN9424_c0_g1_i2.p1  ORF type:complete len:1192 (+),score=255.13 TRINITY_DN9424_c0_g1_i2:36-3611(+)